MDNENTELGIQIDPKDIICLDNGDLIARGYFVKEPNTEIPIDVLKKYSKDTIIMVVKELPEEGVYGYIYLVPIKDAKEGDNQYTEYLWNDKWEKVGDRKVDLSGYYNKEETDALLLNKSNTGHTHVSSEVTLSEDIVYSGVVIADTAKTVDEAINLVVDKMVDNELVISDTLNNKSNTGHTHNISEVTELQTTLDSKQDTLTAGNGIKISGDTISIDDAGGIAIYDTRISDADDWLTNGYAKTSASLPTKNLPTECTGKALWGVILYVAENNTNKAGMQQYFPIDEDVAGTYKGRIYYRSVTGATTPIFGEWHKVPWSTETSLPSCTTADNGKVLKVVNGVPTWTDA